MIPDAGSAFGSRLVERGRKCIELSDRHERFSGNLNHQEETEMIRNSETLQVVGHNLRAREQVLGRTDLKRVWGGEANTSTNTGGARESDHTQNQIVMGQPGNDLEMQQNLNDNWNKSSGGRGGGGGLFGKIGEVAEPIQTGLVIAALPKIARVVVLLIPPQNLGPAPEAETKTKKKKKSSNE